MFHFSVLDSDGKEGGHGSTVSFTSVHLYAPCTLLQVAFHFHGLINACDIVAVPADHFPRSVHPTSRMHTTISQSRQGLSGHAVGAGEN